MTEYTLIDLSKIKVEMGQHWNASERDSVTGRCSQCGEEITQDRCICIVCDTPVIWKGSRTWKLLYGDASTFESKLLRTPTDVSGTKLCGCANVSVFPTAHLLTRWERAIVGMNCADVDRTIDWCAKTMRARGRGMRGLIQFVVNTVEKQARTDSNDVGNWDAVEYGGSDE